MADIFNMLDTWNASGTTFTGIKLSVTDTASAAGSLLMDLQVGGSSKFSVLKGGQLGVQRAPISAYAIAAAGTIYAAQNLVLGGDTSAISMGTLGDINLIRDAANTLAQRNGVNAQTKRLYGTFTDASNYRRLTKTMSAAGVAEIKPEGAGTGVSGNVLHISGLPTANPGPGILWNNAGTPAIGT